ncbi:MAG: hypothetical protein GY811_02725 [Myxococcales bacterium]|nr:hypothetical protein [Myxococcales bacterium]
MSRKRLGEILVDAGVINHRQLEHALFEQRRWGGQVGKILIDEGFVTEDILVRALGKQLNLPVVSLEGARVEHDILSKVSVELAEQHGVFPFRLQSNFLDVAMSDPMNMGIIDELRIRTRLNVRPHISGATEIDKAIRRHYKGDMDIGSIDVDFGGEDAGEILHSNDDPMADMREAEIAALQRRLSALEALVTRDEDVIRKLLGLLADKGVASREEILAAIK